MASALLKQLVPSSVAAADLVDSGQEMPLHPEEARHVAASVDKRRREFALGRRCAHLALEELGYPTAVIAVESNRVPRWPLGVVGSITHAEGYAAAIVAERRRFRALGLDAERNGRVSRELWPRCFAQVEIDWLHRQDLGSPGAMATVMFSAKETYFKAQYPLSRRWLEFHDVRIDIDRAGFRASEVAAEATALGPRVSGRYAVTPELILTTICLEAEGFG